MCDFSHICGVWVAQEALEAEYHYHHQFHWLYVMYGAWGAQDLAQALRHPDTTDVWSTTHVHSSY